MTKVLRLQELAVAGDDHEAKALSTISNSCGGHQ